MNFLITLDLIYQETYFVYLIDKYSLRKQVSYLNFYNHYDDIYNISINQRIHIKALKMV